MDNTTYAFEDYPFEIRAIPKEEGGGFLITFPDLTGCMSDGETIQEAIENGKDAFNCWIEAHIEESRSIPQPTKPIQVSGKFNLRVPKTLHERLVRKAKAEGVSMNTLAIDLLSEGLARRNH